MKVSLQFDLHEEIEMYKMIVSAPEIRCALRDFNEYLRTMNKHGHSFASTDEAIAGIYQSFCESFGAHLFS